MWNSSTESSSASTRRISVEIGENPIGLNTLTALRVTSSRVVLLTVLEVDAVEQVSSPVLEQVSLPCTTNCDASGQQECVVGCFTPGPDENPLPLVQPRKKVQCQVQYY